MGYFSNGTEGRDYQARHCSKCVHDTGDDCPVWALHLVHNGTSNAAMRETLDVLIPRHDDGCGNGECVMFVAAAELARAPRSAKPCRRSGCSNAADAQRDGYCEECL